jgi:hypothetical protein
MMGNYLTDEIFGELFEKAPDHIVGDPHFERVRDAVYAWADEFEGWIDPDSDSYRESLYEAEREGVDVMREKVVDVLESAVYREAMFNESVSVLDLLKTVRELEVE